MDNHSKKVWKSFWFFLFWMLVFNC